MNSKTLWAVAPAGALIAGLILTSGCQQPTSTADSAPPPDTTVATAAQPPADSPAAPEATPADADQAVQLASVDLHIEGMS